MNWYEAPEWLAFTAAIIKDPDDNTPRLAAADWLDEWANERKPGDASAARRAWLIRSQLVTGAVGPLELRPDRYAAEGFTEPCLNRTAGLLIERGWPEWAVFFPHRFTAAVVGPVFRAAPLSTCSVLGACAYIAATITDGRRTVRYAVDGGPENDTDGIVDTMSDLYGDQPHIGRALSRAGRNPHVELYREPGLTPAPIYANLPMEGGAGGTRRPTRKSVYRTFDEVAAAVLKAGWYVGRSWAGQPRRINGRTVPKPHPLAVAVFSRTTARMDSYRTNPTDTYETNPLNAGGPDLLIADPFPGPVPLNAGGMPLIAIEFPDEVINAPVLYGELVPLVTPAKKPRKKRKPKGVKKVS